MNTLTTRPVWSRWIICDSGCTTTKASIWEAIFRLPWQIPLALFKTCRQSWCPVSSQPWKKASMWISWSMSSMPTILTMRTQKKQFYPSWKTWIWRIFLAWPFIIKRIWWRTLRLLKHLMPLISAKSKEDSRESSCKHSSREDQGYFWSIYLCRYLFLSLQDSWFRKCRYS